MHLEGSCRCGAVTFSLQSPTPYPYMRCYCTICRKVGGGGGYAVNLGGDAASLAITGEDHVRIYQAVLDGETSPGGRRFCSHCGAMLWGWDERWPDLLHPFASAIDTPLPKPPEIVHIMLDFKAPWVDVPDGPGHVHFPRYPDESLEGWHRRHGFYGDTA